MIKKEKIVLLFPDGIGVRNYLYSDVFKGIQDDLVLFHNFDPATITTLKGQTSLSDDILIPEYKESIQEKFLRELICLSRLYYNAVSTSNPIVLTNWNWKQKTLSKSLFYKGIEKIAPFFKKYSTILKLEQRYQKAIRKNSFYDEMKVILEEMQPKAVFCSHQRGLKAAPVFAAAKDLGIPTTTVIYSWDNLHKARLALRADNYLVWSEYMKAEMALYYPEILQEQVHVTGTPQFEFYGDQTNIIEKKLFFEKYNFDPNKKIICFSGDDIKTSPDDPSYLKDIAAELTKANLQHEYQILFRKCPVDFSGRFDSVVREYSNLIKEVAPLWHCNSSKEWSAVYPSREDVKLLVSTVFYSDVVVNVGSTMAFDFAILNKPCMFINYDQENKKEKDWSVKTIYQFQHFKSMPSQDAVIWLNNKEEFVEKLTNSGYNTNEMLRWKETVIADYKNASCNIRQKI
ncbi:UDP-glycosyltransferase [Flavobacterium sufflavum]|uniref:UDP-glycosyltransferase n=1 Tax=Flavobacterium sufflavum TaxID=1921138 RepID=A0A437KUR9_9FLAO|nr:CDP-glycerol glycerophosphotransferase family protein [Flavobacterium sufflavum]RVT75898.1 UDP-glycosyltransferase [Flavobacterium sufflavum]